ncbi:MAG TPA: DoxX family protein [Gemmataceae bacterium]|jgi:putative oxidoreductase
MLAYIRKPHADLAALILRMGLGFLFIGYGCIKLNQAHAMSEYMSYNTQQAVGWAELICGSLLAIGFLTRLAALVMIADMIGAIVMVTGKREFFGMDMTAHGETFRPGAEYNIIIILVCLALLALGSGWFSLDHLIFNRRKRATDTTMAPVSPSAQAQNIASAPVVKA